MILGIALREWLSNFWSVYGNQIVPVLVTLTLAMLTWLALKIRSDAKLRQAETEAQIQALQQVANKEDVSPEVQENSKKLQMMETTLKYMAEMFDVAFQNSNLTPEIKDNIAALKNKILYGTEEDLVKALNEQILTLKEQVDTLSAKTTEKVVEVVNEEVQKRVRR